MMIAGISKVLVNNIFSSSKEHDGIIRMFEVEYAKEYRSARRAGVHIDRHFVEEFLKSVK